MMALFFHLLPLANSCKKFGPYLQSCESLNWSHCLNIGCAWVQKRKCKLPVRMRCHLIMLCMHTVLFFWADTGQSFLEDSLCRKSPARVLWCCWWERFAFDFRPVSAFDCPGSPAGWHCFASGSLFLIWKPRCVRQLVVKVQLCNCLCLAISGPRCPGHCDKMLLKDFLSMIKMEEMHFVCFLTSFIESVQDIESCLCSVLGWPGFMLTQMMPLGDL